MQRLVHKYPNSCHYLHLNYSLRVVYDASILHHIQRIYFIESLLLEHSSCNGTDNRRLDPTYCVPFFHEVLSLAILVLIDDIHILLFIQLNTDRHKIDIDGDLFVDVFVLAVQFCSGDGVSLLDQGSNDLIGQIAHHLLVKLLTLVNAHLHASRPYHQDEHRAEEGAPDGQLQYHPLDCCPRPSLT